MAVVKLEETRTSKSTKKPKYRQSTKVKKLYNETKKVNANRPGDYTESQRVTDMYGKMNEFNATKPDKYNSRFTEKIDGILDQIINRKPFEYDMNADPLYQQYKAQYTQQGNQAMRDVMGNAASLTGGYGNSYASTVGSQAYQQYMGQLNDKAMDLYRISYQKYTDEGNSMYDRLGALQSVDDVEYGRYQDDLTQWNRDRDYYTGLYENERDSDYARYRDKWDQYNADRSYATSVYQDERDFDYGRYQDKLSQWNTDRSFEYQQEQDAQDQANWKAQFDYQKQQDAQAQANWAAEFAYQKEQDAANRAYQYASLNQRSSSSGSSGSSGSSQSSGKYETTTYSPLSQNSINQLQNNINGMSPAQAQAYIKELYESGKISKSQASALYEYNTGTAAHRGVDPMKTMSKRGNIYF